MKLPYVLILAMLWAAPFGSGIALASWPEGLIFTGLTLDGWKIHIITPGSLKPIVIHTTSEPRTPTYSLKNQTVVYVAEDRSLHEFNLESRKARSLVKQTKNNVYIQPSYSEDGLQLFLVDMKNGSSRDTDIVALDSEGSNIRPVITQRSAQYDPFPADQNTIYYSNLHCMEGCGRIIQEIWVKSLISEVASQVTLLNAISQQPFVSNDQRWLYFSSNKAGNYHIWRLDMQTQQYEQLTTGVVSDENPVVDGKGNLYFIRHDVTGASLIKRSRGGAQARLELPASVKDIRDLGIGR